MKVTTMVVTTTIRVMVTTVRKTDTTTIVMVMKMGTMTWFVMI
jgi:hypothetical protein